MAGLLLIAFTYDALENPLVVIVSNSVYSGAAMAKLLPFVQARFDYSQSMVEAERHWIQMFMQEVEAGNV